MAQFIETTNGAAAVFPFELKDTFRKAFPSAKWNPSQRRWEVGSRSVKRLKQWLAEVETSGIEAQIAARDEADMSEKEVADLRHEIDMVSRQVIAQAAAAAAAAEAKAKAEELRAALDAKRAELETAKAAAAQAKADEEAAVRAVEQRIAHITTRDQIEQIRRSMAYQWRALKAANRERFEELQEDMAKIRENLEAAGIDCRAVRLAAKANWNRRDRDLDDLSVSIAFALAEE